MERVSQHASCRQSAQFHPLRPFETVHGRDLAIGRRIVTRHAAVRIALAAFGISRCGLLTGEAKHEIAQALAIDEATGEWEAGA